MKPSARISVGTVSGWHFWAAGGAFAALALAEVAGQALRGAAGAGPVGWLLLLAAAGWLVGLVWRERVGVGRAWLCLGWVVLMSLCVMILAEQLFGSPVQVEFFGYLVKLCLVHLERTERLFTHDLLLLYSRPARAIGLGFHNDL